MSEIPPQSAMLYSGCWTPELDETFLSAIIGDLRAILPRPPIPSEALLVAMSILNERYDLKLEWNDVFERFMFMKKRYKIYTSLLRDNDTSWDQESNSVFCDDKTWVRLFKKFGLARAYFHTGEPQYGKLQLIFGLDNVKEETPSKIVINISDTVVPKTAKNVEFVDLSDDEEVNSPMAAAKTKSCRRLFDGEYSSTSVTASGIPTRNVNPPQPKFDDGPSREDNGRSSCASSSPLSWWNRP